MGFVLLLAVVMGGCDPDPLYPVPLEAACGSGKQWLVKLKPAAAPPAGCAAGPPCECFPAVLSGTNWRASALFPGSKVPAALQLYCSYEWVDPAAGTKPTNADLLALELALRSDTTVDTFAPDCPVVSPQSQPQTLHDMRSGVHDDFRRRARGMDPLPAWSGTDDDRTHLVVLDAAPSDGAIPHDSTIEHGRTLAHIARDLTCDVPEDMQCPVAVRTELAMPHEDIDSVNTARGGMFGTRGELARAIHRSVEGSPSGHLILSMALGWEKNTDGKPEESLLPSEIVHEALRFAACNEALSLAAAGNTSDGRLPPRGMLFPAAWEGELVSNCADLALGMPPPEPTPILRAVGGLDAANRPLANTRPGSLGGLAAFGFMGIAPYEDEFYPAPLTGTSVSVTVAAAAAALTWSHLPRETTVADMSSRMDTTQPVNLDEASNCIAPSTNGPPCAVRRVSICDLLEDVPGVSVTCDTGVESATNAPWGAAAEAALAAHFAGVNESNVVPNAAPPPMNLFRSSATPPFTNPQPLWPGCGACVVQYSPVDQLWTFFVDIEQTYPQDLISLSLTLRTTNGDRLQVPLSPNLAPGSSPQIFHLAGFGVSLRSATLSWGLGPVGTNVFTASGREEIPIVQ